MSLREDVLRRAMKVMQNPRVTKVMMDPRVLRFAMHALGARSRAKAALDRRMDRLAKTLGFATRAQVRELEAAVRTLQATLDGMRAAPAAPAAKQAAK